MFVFLLCLHCHSLCLFCLSVPSLYYSAGLGGSVGCASYWRSGVCRLDPSQVWQQSFMEIDHEIVSIVILSLPLIQEGQLSVSREGMCTSTG